MTGTDLIAEARALVGLPWIHCGRNEHGVDCAGLLLLPAYRLGLTTFQTPAYSPGGEEEYLLDCLAQECVPVEEAMQPGDIALFRVRKRLQHLAYLTGDGRMIHANEKVGVCESFVDDRWQERIAGVYRWKGLVNE